MAISAHFENTAGRPREPRRTLRLEARGSLPSGDPTNVLVHNVSATGLLFESQADLAVGEELAIELPHAGITRARVIWKSGALHGCRFDGAVSAATLSAAQLRAAVSPQPQAEEEPDATDETARIPETPVGESFGTRLQRLRREAGLSQSEVASRLGVSKPTVWAWEQGRARPIGSRIATLAEALNVTPSDLAAVRDNAGLDLALQRSREEVAKAFGVRPEQVRVIIEL